MKITSESFTQSGDIVKVYESSVFEEPCSTLMEYLHEILTLNNNKILKTMNRHNICDLDWSLSFSVKCRTQVYREVWSFFYYILFLCLASFSIYMRSIILKLMHGDYSQVDWYQPRVCIHTLWIVLFSCPFSSPFIYISDFLKWKCT